MVFQKLVDQPKTWKNRCKLSDSFDFNFSLKLIGAQVWRDLYQNQGLSMAQIAQKFNAPKSSIMDILHSHGLKGGASKARKMRADNYRATPPYGYKVLAGKLKVNPKELKSCRTIVSLAREKGLSWSAIAGELNRLKVPTRKAKSGAWYPNVVKIIFERWNGKL